MHASKPSIAALYERASEQPFDEERTRRRERSSHNEILASLFIDSLVVRSGDDGV